MFPFARRALTPDLHEGLRAHLGRRPRVLAWGSSPDGAVIGLIDRLVVLSDAGWSDVGWHEVLRGGWDAEASALHWTDPAGEHTVPLTEPGQVPEVFRERVEATILLQRTLDVGAGRAVLLSARRDLSGRAPVAWEVHPGRGVRMEDEATASVVAAELERLRTEYEF